MHGPSSGWSEKNWTLSPRPTPILPPPALQLDCTQGLASPLLLPLDRDGAMKSTASESMPPHSPKHSSSLLDGGQTVGLFPSNERVFFLLFCFFTHHLRALKSQLDSPRKHGETAVSATLKSIDEFKDYKKSLAGWRLTQQVITMPGTRLGGAEPRGSAYFICSNPTESTEKSGSWNVIYFIFFKSSGFQACDWFLWYVLIFRQLLTSIPGWNPHCEHQSWQCWKNKWKLPW